MKLCISLSNTELVAYHGTNAKFSEFKAGFYFTGSRKTLLPLQARDAFV